jgi:hypothetical protein
VARGGKKDDRKKKKEKEKDGQSSEEVVDLSARIGAKHVPPREAHEPPASPDQPAVRLDAPIPSAPKPRLIPSKEDRDQTAMIRDALADQGTKLEPAIPSPRTAPGPGEVDLVVTPLPTPDDWHRFELALRKVRGVGQLRTEYYRHGVLKVRVSYQGPERLAAALRSGVTGYRVRVIGEDRATLQILVTSEADERRPG